MRLPSLAPVLVLLPLAAPAQPHAYTDSTGRTLAFDAPPARVVTFFDYAYGQMATLGVAPVGASPNPGLAADPAFFPDRPAMAPTWGPDGVDIEAIAALAPDLILGPPLDETPALAALAPYAVHPESPGIDGMAADLRALGALLGVPERAEAAVAAMEARIAAYAAAVPGRPSVMVIGDPAPAGGDLVLFTASFLSCALLDRVVRCDWPDPDPAAPWIDATVETLLSFDPDIVLVSNWTGLDRAAHLAALDADPLWRELAAHRAGRVVSLADYPDPYPAGVLGISVFLDRVVPALFPESFPDGALPDAG